MRKHSCYTSAAGSVTAHVEGIFYRMVNIRPVSPTCKDIRQEWGITIRGVRLCIAWTKRVHRDHPSQIMKDVI